ncbi:hypothetical protein ACG33_07520 [Steroidobacter denitrificans]|uniref:Response regulatory domain-containing protein n=1 Tax=Steroidobacter denitrificans TaxID=465721 RepID=A0A127F964_STEDE|nr:response regulator [Steroidobacter denitrificans]AMN46947.1 hypothetical protein ACG33_07520 [Steroidobacter denitrificans]
MIGRVHQPAPAAPRLLLVDDEPRSLRLLRRILIPADRHCLAFQNANAALAALREHEQIEVIITDLRMPEIDGLDFIQRVRKQFVERRWLQFIIVTGQASVDTAVSALRLEAIDYIFKPVLPQNLLAAVRLATQKSHSSSLHSEYAGALRGEQLLSLAQAARSLAMELGKITQGASSGSMTKDTVPAAIGAERASADMKSYMQNRTQHQESLRYLVALQEARSSIFGEALLPDAAWEMLVELMLAKLTGQRIAVTSLCLASKVPVTTALRRIDDLLAAGLVERFPDLSDRRRSYIALSDTGQQKMRDFLARVAARMDLIPP